MLLTSRNLIAILGSSGCGKSSLIKEMLSRHSNCCSPISYTTRVARIDDKPNQYTYITHSWIEQNFPTLLLANIYGEYYATSFLDIQNILDSGQNVILEVSIQNAIQLFDEFPENIHLVHLNCPPHVRIIRLKERGMSGEEILKRQQSEYEKELDNICIFSGNRYHLIDTNKTFLEVVEDVETKLRNGGQIG